MNDSVITLGEFINPQAHARPRGWRKAKLTTADRTEIGYLRNEGFTGKDIASEYGVSVGTVYGIAPVPRP